MKTNFRELAEDKPVCFEARDNKYGAFNFTKTGLLKTMKLVLKSGSIKCTPIYPASYWGCTNGQYYGNNSLMTIITNAKNEAILPPAGDLKGHYKDLQVLMKMCIIPADFL